MLHRSVAHMQFQILHDEIRPGGCRAVRQNASTLSKIVFSGLVGALCAVGQSSQTDRVASEDRGIANTSLVYNELTETEKHRILEIRRSVVGLPVLPTGAELGRNNLVDQKRDELPRDYSRHRVVDIPTIISKFFSHVLSEEFSNALVKNYTNLGDRQCKNHTTQFYELWYKLSEKYSDAEGSSGALRQYLTKDEKILLENAFRTYDENCLQSSLSKIPDEIRRIVGLLEVRGNERLPFCTVTLIDSNKVLTSRHCFIDANTGDYNIGCSKLLKPGLSVRFLSDLKTAYGIARLPQNCADMRKEFSIDEDSIELTLKSDPPNAYPAIQTTDMASNVPDMGFWMIGLNGYVLDSYELNAKAPVESAIRYSPISTCAVLSVNANCLFHTCQTGPRMSGAGLLKMKTDGGIELHGIHTGTSDMYKQCGANAPATSEMNLALRM